MSRRYRHPAGAVPWRPPDGERAVLQQARVAWDAVKVHDRPLADEVLRHLGDCTGSVIRDSRSGITYWLVDLGSADQWPSLEGVTVLGRGGYLAVPPAGLDRPPGVHWRVPFAPDRYLTSAGVLLAGFRLIAAEARRDEYLHARLAEVNQRSHNAAVRPWG